MITEKTKKELIEILNNLSSENTEHYIELIKCTLRGEQVMQKKLTEKHQSHQAAL